MRDVSTSAGHPGSPNDEVLRQKMGEETVVSLCRIIAFRVTCKTSFMAEA